MGTKAVSTTHRLKLRDVCLPDTTLVGGAKCTVLQHGLSATKSDQMCLKSVHISIMMVYAY